jgi:hypothetical protein
MEYIQNSFRKHRLKNSTVKRKLKVLSEREQFHLFEKSLVRSLRFDRHMQIQ